MNKRLLFGISFAAVFAIGMIAASPAFAGASLLNDGIIKDHAAGIGKNKSPAHWETIASFNGNFTQHAVSVSTGTTVGSGIAVPGVSFLAEDEYVFYAVTLHNNPPDDSGQTDTPYAAHGHKVTAVSESEDCAEGQLKVTSIEDIGKASVVVALDQSSSTVKLDDIPASEPVAFLPDVCGDIDATVDPVNEFVVFNLIGGANDAVCIDALDTSDAYGLNGPTNKAGKDGGFSCPS